MTREMGDDPCRCGHTRTQHGRVMGPKCDLCPVGRCEGFVHDVDRAWLVLVRAAEVAARTGDRVVVTRRHAPYGPTGDAPGWCFELFTRDDTDIAAPSFLGETEQLAELQANRWMERMRAAPSSDAHRSFPCFVCLAKHGEECRPMHAGERDPGGWAHPTRGNLDNETSEVVRWARRVKLGEQGDVWPNTERFARENGSAADGLETDGQLRARIARTQQLAVMQVVEEILSLAYCNDLLTVAGGAMPRYGVGDDAVVGRLSFEASR